MSDALCQRGRFYETTMPPQKRYIDRNELAMLLECSIQTTASNEKRWGISAFRVAFNSRVIKFHRKPTLEQLRKIGLISEGI